MEREREAPAVIAKRYRRTLVLAISGAVFAELVIFVVWGLILFPEGSALKKFLWAVVICGVGMGAAVGVAVSLFVVDLLRGAKAIVATAMLSSVILGGLCNVLCYLLDTHYFHFFGGSDSPALFIAGGVVMSAGGGAFVGWLLFSVRGQRVLDRLGM